MNSNWESNIDLINQQIKGELNESELLKFNERLQADMAFAKLHGEVKLVADTIRMNKLKAEFKHLQALEDTLPQIDTGKKDKKNRIAIYRNWKVAAGFLLVLTVFGTYFFLARQSTTYMAVYEEHFKLYPSFEVKRSNNGDLKSKAYSAYDSCTSDTLACGDAVIALQQLKEKENTPSNRFFLANAYLANNNIAEAINEFQSITTVGNEYQLRAKWYLALAHIKQGNQKQAHQMLENIKTNHPDNSYAKKSTTVLQQLRKAR